MRKLKLRTANDKLWTIQVIKEGESYGNNHCMINDKNDIIIELHYNDNIERYIRSELLELNYLNEELDIFTLKRLQRWLNDLDDIELKVRGSLECIQNCKEKLAKETRYKECEKLAFIIKQSQFMLEKYNLILEKAFYES